MKDEGIYPLTMRQVRFLCPNCGAEIRLPESQSFATCSTCKTRLDVVSTLAYLRGLEAFEEGQEMMRATPRKLHPMGSPQDRMAMTLFREAYSSLQLAFQGDLVEDQRQLGIEMMASMATEFSKRLMVSMYEVRYWSTVMAELTSQNEYSALKEKLRKTTTTVLNYLIRWYWRVRQRQLLRALKEFDRKLVALEDQIEFVDLPRARNHTWTP